MEKRESRMHLPTLDDLFTTQEERDGANLEKIVDISVKDIDDFPNHPFKVIDDEEMQLMSKSIKENGILVPVLVRQKEDGRYEMISGHRRKFASKLAGIDKIPCIVRDLTDDEATIIMVDSNMQREKILPSEKAFAYKMKLDAISHKGKRTDLTSSQVATRLDTATMIGKEHGDSRDNVYRYIRLTYLIPKILEFVDNSIIKDKDKLQISLSPAVEISYLTNEEQYKLLDYIEFNQVTPSHAQAIKLKEMSQNKTFSDEKMEILLDEEKPNQTPKLRVSMNRLSNVLPNNLKNDREREEYVIKAVEFYDRYQKQRKKADQER